MGQNAATNPLPSPSGQDSFLRPDDLHFDFHNPRFLEDGFKTEGELIQYFYDRADVEELVQSILSAGYIDFEPLIALRQGNVVLEGNRRLAALRLIAHEELRTQLKISLPPISNPKQLPETIRVRFVDSRNDARGYIGFKHINGPFKWDALAKAKYAAAWFSEGGDLDVISRTLGDNHNTVRRLVNGWFVLKQALADGFELENISKKTFAFSHLYTALTRSAVREFLGMEQEDSALLPAVNPIRPQHRQDLAVLMSWLYGQEQKKEPAIIQSQNPNLNQLSRVLGNSEARLTLKATRNLLAAFEKVEPPAIRFEEALIRVSKLCEDAMALSGFYDGDKTLLTIAQGLSKTVSSLLVVMRAKASGKGESV